MKKPFNTMSKAAIAALFASSVLVPVAAQAAEIKEVQTNIDKVIVENEGKQFALNYDDFNEFVGEGNAITITNVVVGESTFTTEDFNEAFGESTNIEAATALLQESYDSVDIEIAGSVDMDENGELIFNDETTEDEFKVTDVSAINETSVEVTFSSDSAIEESDLTGQTITLKDGKQTLTATYKDESLANGKVVFLLSEDSEMVSGTKYIVSAEWASIKTNEFIFTDGKDVESAKAVTDLINDLPTEKDILENGEKIVSVQKAYNELSDEAKAFVDGNSVKTLEGTVKNYKLFVTSDISGLQVKLYEATTIEAKKALVEDAKEKLAFAKDLGISESEYNFLNDMVVAGEKTITGEEEEVNKEAAKKVEALIEKLPVDKELLDHGKTILETQQKFDELSKEAQAFVSKESVKSLNTTVDTFNLFVKATIDGLQEAIGNEKTAEAKRTVLQKVSENLETAKALGMKEADYNHFKEKVNAGENVVVEAEEAELNAIGKANDAIANLPEKIELSSKAAIEEARTAVDAALSLNKEATIEGLEKLEAAEVTLAKLTEEAKAKAIEAAVKAINEIGNPANFELESLEDDAEKVKIAEEKVERAKDIGVKDSEIVNIDHLEAAIVEIEKLRDKLSEYEKAVHDVNVALTSLPMAANISLEHQELVKEARSLLDNAMNNHSIAESDFKNIWKLVDAEKEMEKIIAKEIEKIESALEKLKDASLEDQAKILSNIDKIVEGVSSELSEELATAIQSAKDEHQSALVDATKVEQINKELAKLNDASLEDQAKILSNIDKIVDGMSSELPEDVATAIQSAKDEHQSAVDNRERAKQVEEKIKDLPKDQNILSDGQKILDTKTVYEGLSDDVKSYVSDASTKALQEAVKKFKLFTEAEISGLQEKIYAEDSLDAKQKLVTAAEQNLKIAKALGMEEGAYNHFKEMVEAGQRAVDEAKNDTQLKVAKEELSQAINDAQKINNGDDMYETESFTAFTKAIAEAKKVLEDNASTLEQIKNATQNLREAQSSLKLKFDFTITDDVAITSDQTEFEFDVKGTIGSEAITEGTPEVQVAFLNEEDSVKGITATAYDKEGSSTVTVGLEKSLTEGAYELGVTIDGVTEKIQLNVTSK